MTDRYAVIGNPIEHSKSPLIHTAFARQTGEPITYERLLGRLDHFKEDVKNFFSNGGRGLNVTVPFKEQAWTLANQRSPRAESAGAVNTLILLDDGQIRGDNTDGAGLVRDLSINHGYLLSGCRILLLGAGGASKGVVRPLLECGPEKLVIANRTASKAQAVANTLHQLGSVEGCGLDELDGQQFDLIINGTAAGLKGEVPALPDNLLAPGGWTYDMMYATEPTAFVSWGKQHRADKALDGLGMLVEQAAESFFLWRRVRPETAEVIRQLRSR
ncbi:MAG: shikimate dehydrogenase [Sedimenticola sp.]|nr:shikimate dehydrogenase [Sedimenticola sp.]MCW8974080.1 shikimate dehydrogenase [Sedimenticola sp.]